MACDDSNCIGKLMTRAMQGGTYIVFMRGKYTGPHNPTGFAPAGTLGTRCGCPGTRASRRSSRRRRGATAGTRRRRTCGTPTGGPCAQSQSKSNSQSKSKSNKVKVKVKHQVKVKRAVQQEEPVKVNRRSLRTAGGASQSQRQTRGCTFLLRRNMP
jgi:hypothetical protein